MYDLRPQPTDEPTTGLADSADSAGSSLDTVAVVIPMHNEASVIEGVIAAVQSAFVRVVCVDDGSSDDSAALARRAGADVVRHPINLGQGAALETGIRYALRDPAVTHVVTFDADGQHDVSDAAAMVAVARARDLQVVLGSRFLGAAHAVPTGRRALLRAATWFSRSTTGLDLTDAHNGLRVFRRDAAAALSVRLHGMSHASEILGQVGRQRWSYAEHPVTVTYTDYSRAKGQRGFNALNIVFDLTYHRLRAAS